MLVGLCEVLPVCLESSTVVWVFFMLQNCFNMKEQDFFLNLHFINFAFLQVLVYFLVSTNHPFFSQSYSTLKCCFS